MNNPLTVLFITALICITIQLSVFLRYLLAHDISLILKENIQTLDVAKLKFDAYLKDFNKSYSANEYDARFKNFKESLKNIAISNALEGKIVFGLTKFSDMSQQEFKDRMLLDPTDPPPCQRISMNCTLTNPEKRFNVKETVYDEEPPSSFDWRARGVVKPVLNQKLCLGCWAFGIVGVVESMSAIRGLDFKSRSIQELLDCSEWTFGCRTGSVSRALTYYCVKNQTIVTEEEYPLTLGLEKDCKLPETYTGPGRLVQYFDYQCNMKDRDMVRQLAFHGPLLVTVDAKNWMNYIGGIIHRACPRGLPNHVVQLVGYVGYEDKNVSTPYYIVRNSYGEDFGENGYVKIAMFDDVCGIADRVTKLDVM